MIEKVADRKPPGGLLRAFARAPIGFYRLGLGWGSAGYSAGDFSCSHTLGV